MTIAFDDLYPGQIFTFGAYPVTSGEIIEFARQFDPQPFHLDEAAAKASPLGGLAASGWHTCAMAMRLAYDGFLKDTLGLGAPGIEETRWLAPVRPGMVLGGRWKVTWTRASQSRPEIGLAGMEAEIFDQTGAIVMTQRHTNLFARRDPSAPLPAPQGTPAARKPPAPEPPALDGEEANRSRFASFLEDVQIGARMPIGSHKFTRAETIDFARRYDPQPFHLDDAAAAASHFGKLSASGWHTASIAMRLGVDTRARIRAENEARGQPSADLGPSPGFRDLHWFRPVFAGDTIAYESTAMGTRASSRPGWGMLLSRVIGVNQEGVRVFETHGASMTRMRQEPA